MAVLYDGREIPIPLIQKTISSSLVKVGIYNGKYHRFQPGGFNPDMSTYKMIEPEVVAHGFNAEDTRDIVRVILESVESEPVSDLESSVDLAGDNELPVLSHIRFQESNGGVTDVLYLGEQSFYVLETNRSTLLPGNLIRAKILPLNINAIWSFDIFEDFNASEAKVPGGYRPDDMWFKTGTINQITRLQSPAFIRVVDKEKDFGGELKSACLNVRSSLIRIISAVKEVVSNIEGTLPDDAPFPEYIHLLEMSKEEGIDTYTLNLLIESEEPRAKRSYSYQKEDWEQSDQLKKKLEIEQLKKDKERYKSLSKALEKELVKIHRRRVCLFFDASGVITPESKAMLDPIREELNALAERGIGLKGYADSEIATALSNSKPRPRHNLKVSLIMAGVLALLVFVTLSWRAAHIAMVKFNTDMAKCDQLIQDSQFKEAKIAVEDAREAFKPGYLRFLVSRKCHYSNMAIDEAIDQFVDETVEHVETLKKANNGRINEFTWELIVEAMEYRPDDPRLLSLREEYIAQ